MIDPVLRRLQQVGVVVDGGAAGVLVRIDSGCGISRVVCARCAGAPKGRCTLRVSGATIPAVPAPGTQVVVAVDAAALWHRVSLLYGAPLAGLLVGAMGVASAGFGDVPVALGAAAGLTLVLISLRLRPPAPPVFELLDEDGNRQ